MTAARNQYWFLDSVAGWQIASRSGVAFTAPAGDITLDPLPANAMFLESTLVGGIVCPVALAGDSQGRVFLLDGGEDRVTIIDLANKRAEVVRAFGGTGSSLRRFKTPRSLTVLPGGSIAIADTGNGRVLLFSGPPYALLKVWHAPGTPMKPCAVASDSCGVIYIVDRISRSILRVRENGERIASIGEGVLTDPVELAVAADRTVAVVEGRGANATVVIFPANGDKPVRLTLVKSPMSLAFDPTGNLFVGTANALISKLQPDRSQRSGWSLAGDGVSDVDGGVVKTAWIKGFGLVAILSSTTAGSPPRVFSMDPTGAFALTGSVQINPLDSGIENCSWHRVQVTGTVPARTSLKIESSTSESATGGWTPFVQCGLAAGTNPDCLVQSPAGRYLQIRFTLQSDGTVSPRIHALAIYFPRQSYLQYLPASYQDDDQSRLFLDRFLSIFQTTFDGIDSLLDNLWRYFNPYLTPDALLPWLAEWVAFPADPTLSNAQMRQLLRNAFSSYSARGTVTGLQQTIQDWTGVDNIRILEHFRLRDWSFLPVTDGLNQGVRIWSRGFYARLQVGVSSQVGTFKLTNSPAPASEPYDWGANQFSVLFPASPYTAAATSAKVQKILDREKPAYTQASLTPIYPRLRVGVQATLGIDAYVGRANAIVLGKLATLRYDAVLSPSKREREKRALGLSPYPRLGKDAKIL
jgi:phage tail-like protein